MKNRQWLLKSRPEGKFKVADFEKREVETPELQNGQVLLKTLYLSFDPTQRGWAAIDTYLPAIPVGDVMRAFGVGQVIDSQHKNFKRGDLVFGLIGWQEYALLDLNKPSLMKFSIIPPYIDLPLFLSENITGSTAYFGMTEIGKPKSGDTVLISSAAGATGSVAGQIAKLKGARVIGIAGGEEKCRWLKEIVHFDEAIDYKNENVEKRLGELCPKGIDVFFDNVGGETLDAALLHLAHGARIVLCGAISQYDKISTNRNNDSIYGIKGIPMLISRRAKIQGFVVLDYKKRLTESILCLTQWIEDGKIVQEFDISEGFENIPKTLIRLFEGQNRGKQLLKLSDPPLPLNKTPIGNLLFRGFRRLVCLTKG